MKTQSKTFDQLDERFIEFLGNAVMNSAHTDPALFDLEPELQVMRWNRMADASKRSRQPELPTSVLCSQRAKDPVGFGHSKQRLHTRNHLPVRFSKGVVDQIPAASDVMCKQVEEGDGTEDVPD